MVEIGKKLVVLWIILEKEFLYLVLVIFDLDFIVVDLYDVLEVVLRFVVLIF